MLLAELLEGNEAIYNIKTKANGPRGKLPLTAEMLLNSPSGDLFGMTMNTGMGWDCAKLLGDEVMIISTKAGLRGVDDKPVALGLHSGHYELDLQMEAVATELEALGSIPFATYVSDQCDGRSQGTPGMFDSLAYRNDAAVVMRRLIRSLPTRAGVIGIATCDKGLPAMMMALVSQHDQPAVLVPGGVTLPPIKGEDLAKIQTFGARYTHGEITVDEAAELGCKACASAGGGCHFLGTAGTSQVVGEALGLALPHSALAPSGQLVWTEIGKQSAKALTNLLAKGVTTKDIVTDKAIENAMMVHAAVGGSTNLLLHIPAIAHAAGCKIPTLADWVRINRQVPRLVSVLPNGPVNHPTLRMFLAGGVPEVMLYLRELGLLHEDVLTVSGQTLKAVLDWWETSNRRSKMKQILLEADGVAADEVIMSPKQAKARGLTSTVTFPVGNIAPDGAVVKSTAIDPSKIGADGVYRHCGFAKVFTSEKACISAIKDRQISAGDVIIIMGGGPLGTGMEETYQVTSALRHLSYGKDVTLLTDARFSGVSTGACIGHIGPEALAGGPFGKLRDGDLIAIMIDCQNLSGSLNFIGINAALAADLPENAQIDVKTHHGVKAQTFTPDVGAIILATRSSHPELAPHPMLPDDTRLWATLQQASGGTWRGSIYDPERIIKVLEAGMKALATNAGSDVNC